MTKIIVDKITALRAVAKYFDIELLGTYPANYSGTFRPTEDIEIIFDFEGQDDKFDIEIKNDKPRF